MKFAPNNHLKVVVLGKNTYIICPLLSREWMVLDQFLPELPLIKLLEDIWQLETHKQAKPLC